LHRPDDAGGLLSLRIFLALVTAVCWSRIAIARTDPFAASAPLGPTQVVLTIDVLPEGTGTFASPSAREHALRKIMAALKRYRIINPMDFPTALTSKAISLRNEF